MILFSLSTPLNCLQHSATKSWTMTSTSTGESDAEFLARMEAEDAAAFAAPLPSGGRSERREAARRESSSLVVISPLTVRRPVTMGWRAWTPSGWPATTRVRSGECS